MTRASATFVMVVGLAAPSLACGGVSPGGLGDLADAEGLAAGGALADAGRDGSRTSEAGGMGPGDAAGAPDDASVLPPPRADASSPWPPPADGAPPPTGSDASAMPPGMQDATMPDASATPSPGLDGSPSSPDAGCKGVICNGQCMDAPDCSGCRGATLLCRVNATCGSDCSACSTQPIECFACDGRHQNPLGTCEPNNRADYCLNGNYSHAYAGGATGARCACQSSSDCPGDTQVCLQNPTNHLHVCYTCGENNNFTQNAMCKGGQSCVAAEANCR